MKFHEITFHLKFQAFRGYMAVSAVSEVSFRGRQQILHTTLQIRDATCIPHSTRVVVAERGACGIPPAHRLMCWTFVQAYVHESRKSADFCDL